MRILNVAGLGRLFYLLSLSLSSLSLSIFSVSLYLLSLSIFSLSSLSLSFPFELGGQPATQRYYSVSAHSLKLSTIQIEGLKSQNNLLCSLQHVLWKFKAPRGWAHFSRFNFWKPAVHGTFRHPVSLLMFACQTSGRPFYAQSPY